MVCIYFNVIINYKIHCVSAISEYCSTLLSLCDPLPRSVMLSVVSGRSREGTGQLGRGSHSGVVKAPLPVVWP